MIRLSLFDEGAEAVLVNARRSARLSGQRAITSSEILVASVEAGQVSDLIEQVGIVKSSLLAELGDPVGPDGRAMALLQSIGVDPSEVRKGLPPGQCPTSIGLTLRRSIARPLQVTLGRPPADTPFAGSGRKVLEVAVWNAKRYGRLAGSLDLFRGVLSDARDPACQAIATTAETEECMHQLFVELHRLDLRGG